MHVLVTTDTLSGVWTHTRELVTGLVTRANRVTLVSFGDIPLPDQSAWTTPLFGVEYIPTAFRLDWMQDAPQDFNDSCAYLTSLIEERKPDILHLNHLGYGALPVDTPRIVVAHGDFISWGKAVHGHEPKRSEWLRWYRETLNRGLAEADLVVAPTVSMLDALRSSYETSDRCTVIYSGRNPIFFNPYGKKDDSILAIGRVSDPGKQVHLLTQDRHPLPVTIVISEAAVPKRKLLLSAEVKFAVDEARVSLKWQQTEAQLRALFSRSSFFAATSRYEPFATTSVEAAFSRCAIIANDIPALRELWGDSALYFERNNGSSLAALIKRLSGDKELRRTYANRAFERAHECFNASRMVEQYLNLYERVLSREHVALAA